MSARTEIPCVDVPEGVSGAWRVERFTVTEEETKIHNIRCMFSPGAGRRTMDAGTYTRLMRGGTVVMSDTKAEKGDHWWAVQRAHGHILINGLGIGMVLNACLQKPEVTHATVIECSPDVVALVAPHYVAKFPGKLTVVNADALTWQPPKSQRFGMVWHDIWDNICADNLPEMHVLHRKYGRRADWQGSWCREECEYYNRRY